MKLIDSHCHLTHGRLAQQGPAVMDRARAAGVAGVICAAADVQEAQAAARLAQREPDVWFTAGVHPHEAKAPGADYLTALEELAAHPRFVAVGEIGLDYHYDFSPREDQRRIFAEQLDLARRLGRRVVVHTREALEDTLAILRASGLAGGEVVFHSFTEGPPQARQVLDLGSTLSFSGIVTFASATDLRETARLAPDGRFFIETDAPYLSPEPVRRMKTNEPANVAHVAGFLAELRGVSPEQLAESTTAAAGAFFRL